MDITFLKEWLVGAVGILQFVLETASAICVFTGFILTVCIAMKSRQEPAANPAIKLTFGRWLLLALELQLAADILNTTVDPDIEGLVNRNCLVLSCPDSPPLPFATYRSAPENTETCMPSSPTATNRRQRTGQISSSISLAGIQQQGNTSPSPTKASGFVKYFTPPSASRHRQAPQ